VARLRDNPDGSSKFAKLNKVRAMCGSPPVNESELVRHRS
jgi:hypothetical protein